MMRLTMKHNTLEGSLILGAHQAGTPLAYPAGSRAYYHVVAVYQSENGYTFTATVAPIRG